MRFGLRLGFMLVALSVGVVSIPTLIPQNSDDAHSVRGDRLGRSVAGDYAPAGIRQSDGTTFAVKGGLLIPPTKVRTLIFRSDDKMIVSD